MVIIGSVSVLQSRSGLGESEDPVVHLVSNVRITPAVAGFPTIACRFVTVLAGNASPMTPTDFWGELHHDMPSLTSLPASDRSMPSCDSVGTLVPRGSARILHRGSDEIS